MHIIDCCDEALIVLFLFICSGRVFFFFFAFFCLVVECFGLALPHGKYLLFKLTLSLPVQHLIPYYAEIFLASSLSHRHECCYAVLGSESLAGSQ